MTESAPLSRKRRAQAVGCLVVGLLTTYFVTTLAMRRVVQPIRLRAAASAGDVDRVRRLLDAGAHVDGRLRLPALEYDAFDDGWSVYLSDETALLYAARHGHVEAVRTLLAAGAAPHVSSREDEDPLDAAVEYRDGLGMIDLLLDAGAYPYPAVRSAAQKADRDVVERLNEAWQDEAGPGADRDKLIASAKFRPDAIGHAIARLLSSPDEPELLRVTREGSAAELRAALAAGADVRVLDWFEWSALHWAAGADEALEKVDALLAAGADAAAVTKRGLTPLMMAASNGRAGVVRRLIEKGVELDAVDDHGNTALHGAVYWSRAEVVELLLDAEAQPDLENTWGHTPRGLAHEIRAAVLGGRLHGIDVTGRFKNR